MYPISDQGRAKSFEKISISSCSISTTYNNPSTKDLAVEDTTKVFGEGNTVSFPEGGLRAWLVVFGSWCALFASLGIMNTMGAFQEYISTHQLVEYEVEAVGWIFSLYAFLTFGVSLFVGPVFDKYGPRWLILSGSVLVTASMALIGVSQKYWHFILSFSIAGGVGSALLFSPSIAIVGHYFNRRRGHATGIAATGGAVGGVVFPLVLQSLITRIGFAWATGVVSANCFMLCILANFCIRGRLQRAEKASSLPDFRILRHRAFSITVLGVFLVELALFVPLTYISSYCTSKGLSPDFSYQVLPVLNAGSVFGRWLPGYYADKIGRYNAATISITVTIISVLAVWLPVGDTKEGIILFALLFGFSSGSNISLTPVCISQLCPIENYGRYYATCFSIVSIGCLTGVPIAGRVLNVSNGSWNGLILLVGSCYVGGGVGFIIARVMATGWKIKASY